MPFLQMPSYAGEGAAARVCVGGAHRSLPAPHSPSVARKLCSAYADETSALMEGDRPRQHPKGPALQGTPVPHGVSNAEGPFCRQNRTDGWTPKTATSCAKTPLEPDALGSELSPPLTDTCTAASECVKQRSGHDHNSAVARTS